MHERLCPERENSVDKEFDLALLNAILGKK